MKNKILPALAITGLFVFALCMHPEPILNKISETLIYEDALVPAEAIVVLTGSWSGNRISGGASLFHKGFGKVIVFSSYQIYPNTYINTLMKSYAIQLGVPEKQIIISPEIEGDLSTLREGQTILKLLEEKGIKNFILVTSKFHTRRAHSIYKQLINESKSNIKFQVYGANDPTVPIKNWWKTRAGKKAIFLEYLKTINSALEY